MVDLEQQIHAWVDAENDGVIPVSADEVFIAAESPAPVALATRRRPRWQRSLAVAAAAAIVLGTAVALVRVAGTRDDAPAAGDGWVHETVPDLGWTLTRPEAWSRTSGTILSCTEGVDWTSTILTNQDEPMERNDGACGGWDATGLAAPGFVGVELGRKGPSGASGTETTPLPADLDDFEDDGIGEPSSLWFPVAVEGEPPSFIRVWIAKDADPADVAALERLIGSVAWPTDFTPEGIRGPITTSAVGDPRTTTFLVCMRDRGYGPTLRLDGGETDQGSPTATVEWASLDQERETFDEDHNACSARGERAASRLAAEFRSWIDRPGASQSETDARRDHVVPAVAALPMNKRTYAERWFDAPEGTWAISRMPDVEPGTDCTLGDADGAYGVDRVCTVEYGEVLLVDRTGAIVRAYPMPGSRPTWLHATDEAVFVGRVGDGAAPESTIARIDRATLEAEVLVFPATDGTLGVPWADWSLAPQGAEIDALVTTGSDAAGTLVDSTIGVTSIDLPAIEELFA